MTRDPWELPYEILVVDDEAFVRETLTLYLAGEGCIVHAAPGGEEALEIAQHHAIEAAVVDIRMPGMDGLTLLSELKRRHPDLEVLMATGFQSLETAVEAMRRGACDYITKPITDLENDLLRFVVRAVERRRLRLRIRELSHDLQRALQELGGLRGEHERNAAALQAIEEFGRRAVGVTSAEEALEALVELLPRAAECAGAVVYFLDGGRPTPVRALGALPEPLPGPPLPEAGAPARWIERAGSGALHELWFPLWGAGEARGWIVLVLRAGRSPSIASRTAVRALADHFALTITALAAPPRTSVDAG